MNGGRAQESPARKRNRFILDEEGIEITGHRVPSAQEEAEAGRAFDRILKNRKKGEGR